MSGRRLDVTATQAISGMLATITGAVAASGLGIAGTIIGAAFMSLATTVGAAVYKHYLARSNDRLRAAAASLAPLASGSAVAAAVVRRHQGHDPDGSTRVLRDRRGAARGQAKVIPAFHPDPARDLGPSDGTETFSLDEDVTRTWFRDRTGTGTTGLGEPGDAGNYGKADRTWHGISRRWLMIAALTLGAFAIAMGSITVFEAIAGKPLETVVWHRSGSGTTIGGLVGSHSPSHHRESPPATTPSPTGSPTSSTSAPTSTKPTPSSPATLTPAPSGSASPGSSVSPGSSAPASTVPGSPPSRGTPPPSSMPPG